jgi:plastocyanin
VNLTPSTVRIRVGRTTAFVLTLAFMALALGAMPARAVDQSVNISGLAFAPASVSVNVGDTVTWTNNDAGIPHTVSANNGAFDSGQLSTGQTFSQTFNTAGTVAYHCNVHPQMTGTVVVAAAGGGATTPAAGTTPASGATTAPPAVGSGLADGGGVHSADGRWGRGDRCGSHRVSSGGGAPLDRRLL